MEFQLRGGMGGMPSLPPSAPILLLVPGACLVGFGLLLFFNEWLLRWIMAGMFVLIGALLLMAGMRMKRMLG
jgi:hypothetical protein